MPTSRAAARPGSEDFDEPGSLIVEEVHFAIVPEWVIDAGVSDAAFRLYSVLLRYGNGTGQRMPSRRLLASRLHRSMDSIDRAMRELESVGIVVVERRRRGRQNLTNRYHVRTTPPAGLGCRELPDRSGPAGGGRTSAATPSPADQGGRRSAATRDSAARVAADPRPDRKKKTQRTPPPPAAKNASPQEETPTATRHDRLLAFGITDIADFTDECRRRRLTRNLPTARWAAPCLIAALDLAATRGWPIHHAGPALLDLAADPATRSPMRLAEAGPWWDTPPTPQVDPDAVAAAEAALDDVPARRPGLQATARQQLLDEGIPLTRSTVVIRAAHLLTTSP